MSLAMTAPARIDDHTSARFRAMVREMTGINLLPTKVSLIEQRLRRRVHAHGLPDTDSYLRRLLSGSLGEGELRSVVDLITTNTTSFFREPDHFTFLRDRILPTLLAEAAPHRPRLKVWSAASSEGAEAFTAAMVLAEAERAGGAFDWAVLGTDISAAMLEKARKATYDTAQMQTVPGPLFRRYFMTSADPELRNTVRIVPELRRRVRFHALNLMDADYAVARDVSVIFLRNVLIYFDPSDKKKVIRRMREHLAPGGFLIVGHAESMVVDCPGLVQVRPTIFRKAHP